jgi:hypothetical protein
MSKPNTSELYEIRLKGHLDSRWAGWFDGMSITLAENGDTVLTGPVVDQTALHGLLKKVQQFPQVKSDMIVASFS